MSDITQTSTSNAAIGANLWAALPWVIAATVLLVLPMVFSANSSITVMNQMAITIIFALAYNMLLGHFALTAFAAVWRAFGPDPRYDHWQLLNP